MVNAEVSLKENNILQEIKGTTDSEGKVVFMVSDTMWTIYIRGYKYENQSVTVSETVHTTYLIL